MRNLLVLTVFLASAACGSAEDRDHESGFDRETASSEAVSAPAPAFDVDDVRARRAAPGITPTAAPGVAFNYRYAFRLPASGIAAVQEQHAQACEKLGINRCRITGMRYRLQRGNEIEAMLSFKLDPVIARQFGKVGIEAVDKADGMLIDAEITGEDAGADIAAADRNDVELDEDLKRIEARLAQSGVPAAERVRLQSEAQRLREAVRANSVRRDERRESLARTPMTFQYGSGDLVPGFDTRPPFRAALESAGENFIGGVTILFVIVVTLLPWALVVALGIWAFRHLTRRFGAGASGTAPRVVAEPEQ